MYRKRNEGRVMREIKRSKGNGIKKEMKEE